MVGIGGIQGTYIPPSQSSGQQSPINQLAKQVLSKLDPGFSKGITVVKVEKGGAHLQDSFQIKLDADDLSAIQKELQEILNSETDESIDTITVVIGGSESIEDEIEKIKKKRRKINKEKLSGLAKMLGIIDEQDAIILIGKDGDFDSGGYIVITSGINEIRRDPSLSE